MTQSDPKLTVTAWAATEGISKQAGFSAVKRCGIPRDPDGRVDPGVASALYRQRTRPRVKTTTTEPAATEAGEIPYAEARRRQAVADATTAEIHLAVLRKQAMWVEDATRLWQSLAVNVKAAMLNLPSRVAPILAAESSAAAVQILLAAEVRQILTDLADGVAAARATVEPQHADD